MKLTAAVTGLAVVVNTVAMAQTDSTLQSLGLQSNQPSLADAAAGGNLPVVNSLLKTGDSANSTNGSGIFVSTYAQQNAPDSWQDILPVLRKYGLDWKMKEASNTPYSTEFGRRLTQEEQVLLNACSHGGEDTVRFDMSQGADPTSLRAALYALSQQGQLTSDEASELALIEKITNWTPPAQHVAYPDFTIRGVHLGMTLPQVEKTLAQYHMVETKVRWSSNPTAETGIVMLDPTALQINDSNASSVHFGISMIFAFDNPTGKLAEMVVSNAADDPTESADSGQIFVGFVKKWGKPKASYGDGLNGPNGPYAAWQAPPPATVIWEELAMDINTGRSEYKMSQAKKRIPWDLVIEDDSILTGSSNKPAAPSTPAPSL